METSKIAETFIPASNIWVSFETSWKIMIHVVWRETLQVSKCPIFGFLEPWEWRNYVPSKRCELVIQWHSFTIQKTWTYIYTVVETANLSCKFQHWGQRTKYHGVYHDARGFPLRHPFLHYSATSAGAIKPAQNGFHYKILTRLYHTQHSFEENGQKARRKYRKNNGAEM